MDLEELLRSSTPPKIGRMTEEVLHKMFWKCKGFIAEQERNEAFWVATNKSLRMAYVTERVQAERALQSASDSASFYLDLLGHDITNQLQAIIGGTTLLYYFCNDQSISKKLDNILKAANKCAQVITKVKRTQDLMSAKVELRVLDEVIEDSIKNFSLEHSYAHITYESPVKEALVRTDTFLDILLYELLENAILHNPKSDKKVWVLLEEEENGYALSISDNGIGISDKRKTDLFDRAQRYGGVGLHLIKQIVDKYKGRIHVCDRITGSSDRGVVFRIWIPKGIADE